MIDAMHRETFRAPDMMAVFAIGRAAGGREGSSPRERETR
jgi:hypothetical protein